MEQKNRLVIVVAIVVVIVAALFVSFGRSLFGVNTPSVVLPDALGGADSSLGSGGSSPADSFHRGEVTPQTVQDVIATLSRPDSYYRELTVQTFWSGGSSSTQVQVWVDGGWSHSRQVLPSGLIRHDLTGEGTLYYWYDGSSQYESTPADERSSDLSQRIPTYETVLELDTADITAAGYEVRENIPCIYVSVSRDGAQQAERYWISVDSGLLVCAESETDGQLTYQMTAYSAIQSPCPASASFQLPDGTLLHDMA